MEKKSTYSINYVSLPPGKHSFEYEILQSFFDGFDYGELKNGNLKVTVQLEKKSKMALADFWVEGTVVTECDRCLDEINLPIKGEFNLVVKDAADSLAQDKENENLIIIPVGEHHIDIAPHIHEFIHLLVPMHRLCNQTAKKECNPDIIQKLNEISVKQSPDDPRWDALKKFKFSNNN